MSEVMWKPWEIYLEKIINQNQFHIPRGIVAIGATIKGLKEAGMVISITSLFNPPIWPVQKTDFREWESVIKV